MGENIDRVTEQKEQNRFDGSEMPKQYDSAKIQAQANELWSRLRCFDADPQDQRTKDRPAFTIVIPPPNVTAALHLGHALNNTLQDILVRFRRMQGYNTLWMPGTDHAGIATQAVVEKRILADEGRRRTDFQRNEFIGRVRQWKDQYEKKIIEQLQSMGCSCDWRRTRFTMDEVCGKAVREAFFQLFKDGLIYRGKRLVNWDPVTQTVLADDEVEHHTVEGHFWYLRYPLTDPVEVDGVRIDHVTVATTRPETMLGDTAVAISPSDPRANTLVGKQVRLPLVGRLIPIVADDHVVLADADSEDEKARFSTGFLKVTPAHDPNDWEIGRRHNLEVINVMAPDGTISDRYGWPDAAGTDAEQLLGMDRFEAREAIVEWFRQEELLEDIRPYNHDIGHSYRSHVPIEPYLSDQWYIAVKNPITRLAEQFGSGTIKGTDVPLNSLAGLALKPLAERRLRFVPDRYEKNYQLWLENLRDWPISRQLWWGHQIPIWSKSFEQANPSEKAACRSVIQTEDGPVTFLSVAPGFEEFEKTLESDGWQRDVDVLDTWFSSALWPFSTLGWPGDEINGEKLMDRYYPGSVLCTAREIITLWVSRMVMMGQYCAGDIPFSDVFIHAMIQDGDGRKMSKSLGNGIDPLDIIDSHGADAMRFTLASMTTLTQDVRMPVEQMELPDGRVVNSSPKFDVGRNFCNKIWNASRFALGNLTDVTDTTADVSKLETSKMDLEDRWILSRLATTIAGVTEQLEQFKFSDPASLMYRFFWNELCDWYLELIKPRMRDASARQSAQQTLAFVLDSTLKLLHPFMPFITEGIYQQLTAAWPDAQPGRSESLVRADWPKAQPNMICTAVEEQMELLQEMIRMIREIRAQHQIAPRQKLIVSVKTSAEMHELITRQGHLVCGMANLQELRALCDDGGQKPAKAAVAVSGQLELYVHDVIDTEAEKGRLLKQKDQLAAGIRGIEAKLGNEKFLERAKPEIVLRERDRLVQFKEQLSSVEKNLSELA